jgi:hypothetical protein
MRSEQPPAADVTPARAPLHLLLSRSQRFTEDGLSPIEAKGTRAEARRDGVSDSDHGRLVRVLPDHPADPRLYGPGPPEEARGRSPGSKRRINQPPRPRRSSASIAATRRCARGRRTASDPSVATRSSAAGADNSVRSSCDYRARGRRTARDPSVATRSSAATTDSAGIGAGAVYRSRGCRAARAPSVATRSSAAGADNAVRRARVHRARGCRSTSAPSVATRPSAAGADNAVRRARVYRARGGAVGRGKLRAAQCAGSGA